jgi:hypothetical protein
VSSPNPVIRVHRFGVGDPLISVVTVSNRADVLERCLAPSLKAQRGIPFEWIVVDNSGSAFDSAPAALNAAAERAYGDTLLFVHQDVRLYGDVWLEHLHGLMQRLDDVGVAGVVGRAADGRFIGFMRDRQAIAGAPLDSATKAQTLDECVLAVPRAVHERDPFDTSLGGWHVYGVDACLRARAAGRHVYVLPLFVHHDSSSSNLSGLAAAHAWVARRHGGELPIHTSAGTIIGDHSTLRAVIRAAAGAVVRRAVRSVGIRLRTGHHALLEELEERADSILVVHFARHMPPTIPQSMEADALDPESVTRRTVLHRVLAADDVPDAALADELDAGLVVLSQPGRAGVAQLTRLRRLLEARGSPVVALPGAGSHEEALAALRVAGWQVQNVRLHGDRAGGGIIELKQGS